MSRADVLLGGVAALGVGAVAAALFTQYRLDMQPCAWCVLQRLVFLGISDAALLGLSSRFMSSAGLEFHGQLSFMKAGLKFADRVTTVSPRYAQEIATPEFGHGLDGVVRARAGAV